MRLAIRVIFSGFALAGCATPTRYVHASAGPDAAAISSERPASEPPRIEAEANTEEYFSFAPVEEIPRASRTVVVPGTLDDSSKLYACQEEVERRKHEPRDIYASLGWSCPAPKK